MHEHQIMISFQPKSTRYKIIHPPHSQPSNLIRYFKISKKKIIFQQKNISWFRFRTFFNQSINFSCCCGCVLHIIRRCNGPPSTHARIQEHKPIQSPLTAHSQPTHSTLTVHAQTFKNLEKC